IKHETNRTVRIPDGRRLFASVGLTYHTGNWTLDAGYIHVWMRDGNAKGKDSKDSTLPNPDVHYYNAGAHIAGLGVQYEF
ncbi:MAG: outer membrane protein transport protein, partial [Alphaproteobacteria bacterium]